MSGMTEEEVTAMLAELRQQFEQHGPPFRVQTGVDSADDGDTWHVLSRWHLKDGHVHDVRFAPTDERSAEHRASLLARTIRDSFADAGCEVVTDPLLEARVRADSRRHSGGGRTTPRGTRPHQSKGRRRGR